MSRGYTREQINEAASTDLYEFLMENYYDDFRIEGREIHMRDHHALTIKAGASWYHDFSSDETGNGIDLLRKYYGYSFQDAVAALLGFDVRVEKKTYDPMVPKKIVLPKKWPYDEDMIYKYLCNERKIPRDTVRLLLEKGLIYQEWSNHIVFVNYDKTSFQVRATYDQFGDGRKIISSGRTTPDRFWYFMTGKDADTVYICEGAVDAISLYELHERMPGLYVSMGGVSNQSIIDRIVTDGRYHVVLAVDNDEAGQNCRDRNPGLDAMFPPSPNKDWNEMLTAGAPLPDYTKPLV